MIKVIQISLLLALFWPAFAIPTPSSYTPQELQNIIYSAAERNGVPKKVLFGICKIESNLSPTIINKFDNGSGSYGLCQLKVLTARGMGFNGKRLDLLNPHVNAQFAAKLLKYHMDECNTLNEAINAYNTGYCNNRSLITKYTRLVYSAMRNL